MIRSNGEAVTEMDPTCSPRFNVSIFPPELLNVRDESFPQCD
jgi:hypothetical protein